jgi:hypothetical protein
LIGKIMVKGISKDSLKSKIEELLIENKIAKKPLASIKILNTILPVWVDGGGKAHSAAQTLGCKEAKERCLVDGKLGQKG